MSRYYKLGSKLLLGLGLFIGIGSGSVWAECSGCAASAGYTTPTCTPDCAANLSQSTSVTNNINTNPSAISNAQLVDNSSSISVSSFPGTFGGGVNVAPPSSYGGSPLYNGAWNFIPPHILFHPSKTIGDNSPFCKCRLIKISTPLKMSLKDKLFGVFDERNFVASGLGAMLPQSTLGALPVGVSDSVIVCGLNTNIPKGCAKFLGSGHVFMENYATTEGALVGLARMAGQYGANLIGNVNCAYAETTQNYGLGLGAGFTGAKPIGNATTGAGSLGASWNTGITKRPVQPYCTGDFFLASGGGACGGGNRGMGGVSQPGLHVQPRMYRRYLAPSPSMVVSQTARYGGGAPSSRFGGMMAPQPMGLMQSGQAPMMTQPRPLNQSTVRGYW